MEHFDAEVTIECTHRILSRELAKMTAGLYCDVEIDIRNIFASSLSTANIYTYTPVI